MSTLQDVVNHGVDAGYPGFTTYVETMKFYDKNRKLIRERLKDDANSRGMSVIDMVKSFRVMNDMIEDEIAEVIYAGKTSDRDADAMIKNGLAWYALEAVAFDQGL